MFCRYCGNPMPETARFCPKCGASQDPAPQKSPPPAPKKKGMSPMWKGAVCSLTAMVLVVSLLVTGFWYPAFLRKPDLPAPGTPEVPRPVLPAAPGLTVSDLPEEFSDQLLTERPPAYAPQPVPLSGTKAFQTEAAPGLTISAPENALDQERVFRAEPLTEDTLDSLMTRVDPGFFPLAGFEIDAGMEERQLLPGNVELAFDLQELGIPEQLREFAQVVHIPSEGSPVTLISQLEGNILKTQINHNSLFVIGWSAAAVTVFTVYEHSSKNIPDGTYCRMPVVCGRQSYSLCFLEKELHYDAPEFAQIKKMEQDILRAVDSDEDAICTLSNGTLGFTQSALLAGTEKRARMASKKLAENKDYLKLLKTTKDPAWLEANVWPESAARTAKYLRIADDYLYDDCGLKRLNYRPDIYVVDNPKGVGKLCGEEVNKWTMRPYLLIYKNSLYFGSEGSLAVTVVHELFHAIQSSRYIVCQGDGDVAFMEATALVLERNAYRDYVKRGLIAREDNALTECFWWGDLRFSLLNGSEWKVPSEDEEQLTQRHGYTASHFIEFMQKTYGNSKSFMHRLCEGYSNWTWNNWNWDWVDSMVACTSGSEEVFLTDYLQFCVLNTYSFCMYGVETNALPEPILQLAPGDISKQTYFPQSLSCRCRKVTVDSPDGREFNVVVVLEQPEDACDQVVRLLNHRMNPVANLSGNGSAELGCEPRFFLMEINPTREIPDPANGYSVFILDAPEFPLPERVKNQDGTTELVVQLPESDPRVGFVLRYEYNGTEFTLQAQPGERELRVPEQTLMDSFGTEDLQECAVTLRKYLPVGDKTYLGPWSDQGSAGMHTDFSGTYPIYEAWYSDPDRTAMRSGQHHELILAAEDLKPDGSGTYQLRIRAGASAHYARATVLADRVKFEILGPVKKNPDRNSTLTGTIYLDFEGRVMISNYQILYDPGVDKLDIYRTVMDEFYYKDLNQDPFDWVP